VSANDLLQNLKHRKIRDNQWVAVCPAHDDKSPSLHIAQKEDGRILIHCKAGCGANEVLGALGLDWSTLFPETDENFGAWRPRVQESKIDDFVVEIFEADIALGKPVSAADKERYRKALMNGGKKNGFIDELLKQA
jgi:DNA primase